MYWLMYLDTFKEPQYRFRIARRLLIGSAEDGHSVGVMEEIGSKFWKLCKPTPHLIDLAEEAIRICKLPNWWHPDSGGPDYIHGSLVGQRAWLYKVWNHKVEALQKQIQNAIDEKDKAMALGAVMTDVIRAFIQPEEGNASKFFVQATWDDVPHLDAASKQALLASIPPYQREARSKGVPQLGAGAIYQIPESDIP